MGRRKLESIADSARAIKNGFGRGSGEAYVLWIRAQDISSHGRSIKLPGITIHRQHHLLSDHEKCFFFCAIQQIPPIRVTITHYWVDKHDGINPIYLKRKEVRSKANCKACHPDAEQGTY